MSALRDSIPIEDGGRGMGRFGGRIKGRQTEGGERDSDEWREGRCLELNKSEKSGADHFQICISRGDSQGCKRSE